MFTIHKSDTGAVAPWEYLPAAAGTYKVGQMLNLASGKLNAINDRYDKTPAYLCMADVTALDGQIVPAARVTDNVVFKTEFGAGISASVTGGYPVSVAAGGLAVTGGSDGNGTFWVTAMEDDTAAEGGIVYGRFA